MSLDSTYDPLAEDMENEKPEPKLNPTWKLELPRSSTQLGRKRAENGEKAEPGTVELGVPWSWCCGRLEVLRKLVIFFFDCIRLEVGTITEPISVQQPIQTVDVC